MKYVEEVQPNIIISLGLAAGHTKITPERIAINIKDGKLDNAGVALVDEPIYAGEDEAYFSTLPIRAMVNSLMRPVILQPFQIRRARTYAITLCMKGCAMRVSK